MSLRRTTAIATTLGALALSLAGAPSALAAANPGTVTISYDLQSSTYVLSSSTVGADIGDTFIFSNGMGLTDVQLINGTGFVLNDTGSVPCLATGDCPISHGSSMTVGISNLGTVLVKDLAGTNTLATLTITEPSAMTTTDWTAPALDSIYPTAYVNANGGTCTGTLQFTKYAGQNAGFVAPTSSSCTRSDYSLAGWARTPEATSPEWATGADIPIGDESFTVYAVWIPEGVQVTYDANVGLATPCLSEGVNQQTVAARRAGPYVIALTAPVADAAPCAPDGYTLTGWATSGDGPVALSPGESLAQARSADPVKMRAIAPVESSETTPCCPTARRAARDLRVVAPIDSSGCTRSAHLRVVDIGLTDQGTACEAPVSGDTLTLYAVWGRDITVACPETRGKPLWTFDCTDFGAVPIGATATIAVRVTNQSTRTHVLLLKAWPADMAVNGSVRVVATTCAALAPKASCLMNLAWTPAREGALGTVPLIMCQDGNPNQCYQPSAAQQLRGTGLPPTSLVSYGVELSSAVPAVLPGTSTTVTVRPFRNDAPMPGASVALSLSPGLTFPDGTTTATVDADYSGVARATVLGSTVGSAAVTAAYGNATSSLPLAVSNVLVEFDKTSIKAGEQATATLTATPNTRIKYTTFGKLAERVSGAECGAAGSARRWGVIAGISREAATVTTDAAGHATVVTCGLLAPAERGTSRTSTAGADALGQGRLLALPAEAGSECGATGCYWTSDDTAAASTADLDVRTFISLAVSLGSVPVVANPISRSLQPQYSTTDGAVLKITSPASANNRLYAFSNLPDLGPRFSIANTIEANVTKGKGPFLYTASSFTLPTSDSRIYLNSGQQLRLYYVRGTGPAGDKPTLFVDVIVEDPYAFRGTDSYVVFAKAVTITAPFNAAPGTSAALDAACAEEMGVFCAVIKR